ncbi:MAG: agmatine deiminase family protein [Thermoplasmatales archaeon]|nr:agmatine deiminase family protein [Thermoplasmatales archaeon]
MRKLAILSILISLLFIVSTFVNAQQITTEVIDDYSQRDKIWFENNPDSLPIWLTQDELHRLDEIGKGFQGTSPPPTPVRMPGEFEPMQGVLIRYSFGISYQIIAEMSEDVEVITIVANAGEENYVTSQYQSYGVNLNNCDFLIAPSDSYWTRDYGPWFVFSGDDEQGIVDMIYNRPSRPNDDIIPTKYGNWKGIPIYAMSLVNAGGNYMTDGQGISVSTDLVWSENPGLSHAQIDQMLEDYCGIDTYHVVPDALGAYIKHIDCWAKFLSPDTIMIIEPSTSHSHYDDIEDAVDYFESQISCYGTPYNVVRVYSHMSEPYINSLILNDKVFVPVTGSQWDDEAIESYENALPGYEVLGFTGSWQSTDALHCRAKGIVDRYMLYIEHTPLYGIQSGHDGYEINAKIMPYSGESLDSDSTGVYWKTEGESWNFIEMDYIGNDEYNALIPPQETGTVVYYYVHAEDNSGRSENHPYIGAPMAYSFTTDFDNSPPEITSINGSTNGKPGETYEYCINVNDPDEDDLYVLWEWGDGDTTGWLGPYAYAEEFCASHSWDDEGTFTIKVKVRDIHGAESDWATLEVTMTKSRVLTLNFFQKFFRSFQILKYLINFLY